VNHQDFFELALGERKFDGVFANASLFHVACALLPAVLDELARVLVPRGVLFCSNPRAFDGYQEGWNAERRARSCLHPLPHRRGAASADCARRCIINCAVSLPDVVAGR